MSKRVARPLALVTGATGMVGPSVVERLAATGFAVRVLALDAPDPRLFGSDIDVRVGDVADPSAARSAAEGAQVIVHMAALLHAPHRSAVDLSAYRRTNVEGTRAIMDAAIQNKVRRLVLFSTIAVYGTGTGNLWNEDSPVRPETPYAVTKLEAERIVLAARRPDGASFGVVLRLAAVLGPNLKGNYARLVRALADRRFAAIGRGVNRRAFVNHRDAAAATLLALTHPSAAGRVYNVSDGEDYRVSDIIDTICEALGRRPPRVQIPLAPVRLGVGAVESLSRLINVTPPLSRSLLQKYTEDVRVDNRLIREELGFVPTCGLREGWTEAVAAMRACGQI